LNLSQSSFITVLQHEQVEGLGTIAEALARRGISPRYVRARAGDAVPGEAGASRGLIVMGGPMGVYEVDRYPFLRDEMRLIEQTLSANLPVLGICLGSQLLAHVLGADVKKSGGKEIGWFDVSLMDAASIDPLWRGIEPRFPGFHWHGDVFTLPAGATSLAASAKSSIQAFRHGTAYGFLFHLEATEGIVRDMVNTWPEELDEEGLDGEEITGAIRTCLPTMKGIAERVFDRFAGLL
jgi:GMP synthase (glutamine-hydrolysing)